MAKNHARERNNPFYAKTKVSEFANFEVGRLMKKKMEKSAVYQFSVCHCSGVFYLL